MRVLSLIAAAAALASTVTAASNVVTYTVSCQTKYIVQNGDTCSKIGKAFNIYTSSLKKWNPSINAGCTNLYIDQILCLSQPTTQSSAVAVGTTAGTTTKTSTKTSTTTGVATTMLAMAGAQCQTDDDCSGARCCNLANNQCVLDPNNNICDIPPTTTITTTTTALKITTTAATGKTTTATATKTTTTSASAATCYPGSSGLNNGDGYSGYCCTTSNDCLDTCVSGKCNGAVNSKTSTITATATATATGKTTTTKTTTTTAPVTKTTSVAAAPTGLTVQISSSKDFCFFLPPSPGNKANNGGKQDVNAIADSEKYAAAFCTTPNINAPGAGLFPSGFITSASYQTNTASGFVQIRGTLNIAAYDLSSNDQGGQYDNHGSGSPAKSTCSGYPYYVNLVEPNTGDFCIRCCETYSDCNAGRSAYGCNRVVPAL